MKIIKYIIIAYIFTCTNWFLAQDHVQDAHQHLVREAWSLLRATDPSFYNNFEMNFWIGNNNTSGPWDFTNQERVVAGVWREDEEDVVYNYWCWFTPTNTHFWYVTDPNNPNQYSHEIDECTLAHCEPPANAWEKIQKYLDGGWRINKTFSNEICSEADQTWYDVYFDKYDGSGRVHYTGCGYVSLVYDKLIEGPNNLYHKGYMKVVGYCGPTGVYIPITPVAIKLHGEEKFISYEILGRIAHLLTDQSVPAHTHLDAHPDLFLCPHGDSYESRMDGQYQNYTATNCGGSFVNPFLQNQYHPVYYLTFLMNQIARWFPSNDAGGYSYYGGSPFNVSGWLFGAPYWTNSIFTEYGANGIPQDKFEIIANYCFKNAIRITAGLLYWFAKKIQECQDDNLNLENITVNSNEIRDYCAKYSLMASGPGSPSYFNIEPNATVRFNSGNTITLKPGFHAKTGSFFMANVTPTDQNEKDNSEAMLRGNTRLKNKHEKKENIIKNIPKEFSLSQNYPNPFNPSTLIQYGLKENVNVKITVYDILGRVVRSLVNENQDAGYKSVVWDGTNNFGSSVATGLYIYKIEAGSFVDSKKMLLLK